MALTAIIRLMRVHQYVKNTFVLVPLFFSAQILNPDLLTLSLVGFIAFSLVASAIYIFNDYQDIDADKLHPTKKFRPLASTEVSKPAALVTMTFLAITGLATAFLVSGNAAMVLCLYILLNIAYSIKLKHVVILDVTIIATGFVLRLFVGAFVTNIELSMWIVLMTFLLALFLALAKRRDDVLLFLDTGKKARKVIDGYNLQFLDTSMAIMASVVLVAYINYSTSVQAIARFGSQYLYLTSLFVILGIMRYLQITFVEKQSGSPTKIVLRDRFIQIVLIGWILSFGGLIY